MIQIHVMEKSVKSQSKVILQTFDLFVSLYILYIQMILNIDSDKVNLEVDSVEMTFIYYWNENDILWGNQRYLYENI